MTGEEAIAASTNPDESLKEENHERSCIKALMTGLADDVRVDVCLFVPRLKLDAIQALSRDSRDLVEGLSDRLPLHKLRDVYLRELNEELRLEYLEPNPLGKWITIQIDASTNSSSFAYLRNAYIHRFLFEDGAFGAFPNLFEAFYSLKRQRLLHTVVNELIVKGQPFTLIAAKPMPIALVEDGQDTTPVTWLAESVYAEVVHLLSKTLSPKRLDCDLRFDISAEHVIELLRHPWVNSRCELDLGISYVFSPRMDVHVYAESRNMAAQLAKYLAEDLEGSDLQILSVHVANAAIFANEYAKRFISATDPTPIPALTFEEHHQFNPMRPAKPREAVFLDGAVFGPPLVQVPELRKVNVTQDQPGMENYAADELQQTEVYLIRNASTGLEATVSCAAYRSFIMPGVPSTALLCQFRMGNHVPQEHEVNDYFVAAPWKVVENSH